MGLDKQIDNAKKAVEPILEVIRSHSDLVKYFAKSVGELSKDEQHISAVIKAIQAPRTISDKMFVYKLDKCLGAAHFSEKDLDRLNKKLSGKKKERFWKLIFTSVQSHDDEQKSVLVGKVMLALSIDRITYEEAIRMIHVSNSVYGENLSYLLDCYQARPATMPPYARQEFASLGLLGITQQINTWSSSGGTSYPLTNFGAKFVGVIFDYPKYPGENGLKIGIDDLVGAAKNPGDQNRIVVPLKEAIDKEYWYGKAVLVVRSARDVWVSGGSVAFKSSPIYAGDYGEKTLADITSLDERVFTTIRQRTDLAHRTTLHYYSVNAKDLGKIKLPDTGSWVPIKSISKRDYSEETCEIAFELAKLSRVVVQNKIKY